MQDTSLFNRGVDQNTSQLNTSLPATMCFYYVVF